MTAMLPGAFAKASIETRFEDTLVSAHRVASARRTSSRRCSAAMSDRAPEVRLRLDRLTALRGGQGPHRRRRRTATTSRWKATSTSTSVPPNRNIASSFAPSSVPRMRPSMYNTAWFSQPQRRSVHLFPTLHLVFPSWPRACHPLPGRRNSVFPGFWFLSSFLRFERFWVGVSRCCFFLRVRIPAFPAVLRKYYG